MISSFNKNRPLSPHIQVYKPQITTLLSILHRGTGIILYGGGVLWSLWFLALAKGSQSYENLQAFLLHPFGLVILLGFSFSFFYHLCNGIRHLLWDAGVGFELPDMRRSGWMVIMGSFFLTGMAWLLGILWGEIGL